MDSQRAELGTALGSGPASRTWLAGRRLALARALWVALVTVVAGLFVASLPANFALLRRTCLSDPCAPEQLTPEGLRVLQSLGLSIEFYAAYNLALVGAFALGFFAVAAIIFWRRSDDPMGLFVSLTLAMSGVFLPSAVETLALVYPALTLPIDALSSLGWIAFAILFYLFPDGRFVPSWSRWLVLAWIWTQAPAYFAPASPVTIANWPPVLQVVSLFGLLATCVYAQVYRYRRVSNPVQRQQTKWVVFGMAMATLAISAAVFPPVLWPALGRSGTLYDLAADTASGLAVLLIPVTIGIALLRHRLWDIDIIINRTLVYAALTGALVAMYATSVLILHHLFRALTGQSSQFAVVGSTLAIAVAFNPLRTRIQGIIDQRFYRKKYDAVQTLTAFGASLREEVDLGRLTGTLLAVVEGTMQPAHASLWLRAPRRAGGQVAPERWRGSG